MVSVPAQKLSGIVSIALNSRKNKVPSDSSFINFNRETEFQRQPSEEVLAGLSLRSGVGDDHKIACAWSLF